jgi:uncharacterized lipoprotein YmbA
MKEVITVRLVLLAMVSMFLGGCANLKPVVQNVRYFVLSPSAPPDSPVVHVDQPLGLGAVVVPGYLLQNRLAIRRSNNEIRYAENLQWAERLDKNIQRVLAANLRSHLGSSNIYLSAWRREEVSAEVHVSLDRFEIDEHGNALLEAKYLITSSGSEKTKRTGASKISRQGTSVSANPDEAVATLSAALAALSREIADALSSAGNP